MDNVSVSTRTSSMDEHENDMFRVLEENNSTNSGFESERTHKSGKKSQSSRQTAPESEKQKLLESYKVKYKTELCKNFEIKGTCKWGNNCCFAHGRHELRKKTHLNSNYKTKICKHYHRGGICPYGLRCQYFHIRSSHKEFYTAFVEKLEIKMKENPEVSMYDMLPQVTKLVPRLNCLNKYALDNTGEKSILELFRNREF